MKRPEPPPIRMRNRSVERPGAAAAVREKGPYRVVLCCDLEITEK